jgi:tRNA-(MS[2]IO[6]A)-hydroxylase (MiaE)-like
MATQSQAQSSYTLAMGQLLVLYTQVDQFIMEACADRLNRAPGLIARMGLAKQVGDECRHVAIQRDWMAQFGVDPSPIIDAAELQNLHEHFRGLDWADFLIELYLVIEALGSQAVEQIVPLADPGTRESLRVPLQDELDHVAFGMSELEKVLAAMDEDERQQRLAQIPEQIESLVAWLTGLNLPIANWFEGVGSDYRQLRESLQARRDEMLLSLAA